MEPVIKLRLKFMEKGRQKTNCFYTYSRVMRNESSREKVTRTRALERGK